MLYKRISGATTAAIRPSETETPKRSDTSDLRQIAGLTSTVTGFSFPARAQRWSESATARLAQAGGAQSSGDCRQSNGAETNAAANPETKSRSARAAGPVCRNAI